MKLLGIIKVQKKNSVCEVCKENKMCFCRKKYEVWRMRSFFFLISKYLI